MNDLVQIGLIQSFASSDLDQNLSNAVERCLIAAEQGAQVICLTELFRSPYPCQIEDHQCFEWAESLDGPSIKALQLVAEKKSVVIIAPIFEERSPGLYHNSAAVIDADGSIAGVYRKMHIPDDPGFYEKFYFTPGDLGFQAIQTRYAKIGILICWDQWFPEAARLTAMKGAEILFYPTAIGTPVDESESERERQHTAWETIQRSHAIANGTYVVSANRAGVEEKTKFWGQSFICDPMGEIMEKSSEEKEEIVTATCSLTEVKKTRQHWPFFRDRRIDHYSELTKIWSDQ
ncbi:MAG: carbon-nitrogen hydrolase [Verrucomicrobiota bacterium]